MVFFTKIATKILEARYLIKDKNGNILETPEEMLKRVAKNIASADLKYNYSEKEVSKFEKEFFDVMDSLEFLPNSPTLMNAGTIFQQLSACFVLPVNDNLDSIFSTLKNTAKIQQTGGGTGFNFSNLRPYNDLVRGLPAAAGPIGFMKIFDITTDVIKQGGRRRGANMGILDITHPDIIKFISAKVEPNFLKNFNISVAITDEFMEAVLNNNDFNLINPRTNEIVKTVNANKILDLISLMAWKCGDPGIIYIDTINKKNPLKKFGLIKSTNPCGEVPLYPYEACNLGSINLSKLVKDKTIDYSRLKELIHIAVHFLDNVVDMSRFPIKEISDIVQKTRKIGLGVMGFADLLFQLEIPYNSKDALDLVEEIMKFFRKEALSASEYLAEIKGPFPYIDKSIYYKKKNLRNATLLSIAPTGTISLLANCSSGIEPVFGLSYTREMLDGKRAVFINEHLERKLKAIGLYSESIINTIKNTGTIHNTSLPKEIKEVFITAMEILPIDHLKMQATFQKYVDNSISKTINLPTTTTPDKIRQIFIDAWNFGCKGITVYRDKSKDEQVLTFGKQKTKEILKVKCPDCKSTEVIKNGRCFMCKSCGYSVCNL
ncbi:MAG: adenosylcobalamin-dependent ribonucleoside-diphosphate reductase [Candidatus Helarchaeota archaeon]